MAYNPREAVRDRIRNLSTGGRALIVGALLTAVALRLAFALVYWVNQPLVKDEQEYLLLASRVAHGDGFTYPDWIAGTPRFFERPPGFVLFLAGILSLTADPLVTSSATGGLAGLPVTSSDVPLPIKIAQSLLGGGVVLLVAALAHRGGGARAASWAAWLAALYPPMGWVSGYVLSEVLYSVLALGMVCLLLASVDSTGRRERPLALSAGALAGAALLTKEGMIFFLPLAGLGLIWRRRTATLVAFALGVSLLTVPWIVRNYAVHGRIILTAAHGGVTLWTGNNPLARGEGDLAANPDIGRARAAIEARHPGYTNQQMDDVYYAAVLDFVGQHPGAWLVLEARKLFFTFVPLGPSYTLHSSRYYFASVISYSLMAPVALLGLWRLVRAPDRSPLWALGLLALSAVAMCLVFFPQERFRIPVLDPAAVVAAAVWLGRRRS